MPSTILLEGAETFWAPNKNSRLMVNIIKWWSWDTPGVHGWVYPTLGQAMTIISGAKALLSCFRADCVWTLQFGTYQPQTSLRPQGTACSKDFKGVL